jgi:hypothetical protein
MVERVGVRVNRGWITFANRHFTTYPPEGRLIERVFPSHQLRSAAVSDGGKEG